MPQYVRSAGGSIIMAHRVYVDSTDDFVMWRTIDAIGPISHPRVLVVDDYPAGADALQLLLEQDGFEARTLNDGSLACAVAEEWLPFAVVVDIVMPGVTGLELARRLRAGVLTRDMLLVAFTARASNGDRSRALEAGFDVYCAKPLTPGRLLTVLESFVGR
jgi:CheY-like chemotaxis protein